MRGGAELRRHQALKFSERCFDELGKEKKTPDEFRLERGNEVDQTRRLQEARLTADTAIFIFSIPLWPEEDTFRWL